VVALSVPLALPGSTALASSAVTGNDAPITVHAAQVKGDSLARANRRVAIQKGSGNSEFGDGIRVGEKGIKGDGRHPRRPSSTGSQALIDAAGVKYFINTNITFSTSSSASGGMSEASFTHSVSATTLNGGTVQSRLNDAYDGYNSLCISLNGTTGTCQTGNANWTIYNKNGPATVEGNGRQIDFPVKTIGNLSVSRKVFVPSNDQFARWLNIITNNGGTPQQVVVATGNNLGSDANTIIVTSSNGNNTAETSDTWVTTFQNYAGTTSSDPRLGHVLQGPGATVPVSNILFANGDDNPWWDYTFTLQPGQTGIIMNFAVVQPSKAAAAAKSAQLVGLPANALQFMSSQEENEVLNFNAAPPTPTPTSTSTSTPTNTPTNTPTDTPTNTPTNTPTSTSTNTPTNTPTSTPTATATATSTPGVNADLSLVKTDQIVTANTRLIYWLNVTNNGPSTAQNIVITDPLPPQVSYLSVSPQSGSNWNCTYNAKTRTVTCTISSLAAKQSSKVGLLVNVLSTSQPFTNCATVSASTYDPNLNNNQGCLTLNQNLQPAPTVLGPDSGAPEVAITSGSDWSQVLQSLGNMLVNWIGSQHPTARN
ncbi:MAG: DUF11 domain-containing protein, partial [Anaerolineae bacterium]